MLLSQSHSKKRDMNLDGKLTWRKPHCQQTLRGEELLGVILAPSLEREPHSTLKGRVQRHV